MDAEVRRLARVLDADPSRENLERLDSARRRTGDGPWIPAVIYIDPAAELRSRMTFSESWATLGYWISRAYGFTLPEGPIQFVPDPE